MMRWLGFDFDQVGLEHMVARVSGLRNSGQMNVQNTRRRDGREGLGPVAGDRPPALP